MALTDFFTVTSILRGKRKLRKTITSVPAVPWSTCPLITFPEHQLPYLLLLKGDRAGPCGHHGDAVLFPRVCAMGGQSATISPSYWRTPASLALFIASCPSAEAENSSEPKSLSRRGPGAPPRAAALLLWWQIATHFSAGPHSSTPTKRAPG